MKDVAWSSQQYPPEGASAAEGIRNQLGRPELDLLTILVRESAQNSWDARQDDTTVDYRIDLDTLGPTRAPVWRDLLLRGAPTNDQLPLRPALSNAAIRVLTVSDRGTSGLGGPTRADSAVVENHDFVSFIRNIGEPRDTDLGGGTYGFGKGIFYLMAKSGTVLIHTRCRVRDGFETRLIGCALWKSYTVGEGRSGRRFTGRHWWGERTTDLVEPIRGDAADDVARKLGLRPFSPNETGTTVVIVDPDLDEREPRAAAQYLADTILWNLWPKMLTRDEGAPPPMRFSVYVDGAEVPVPDPRETRPVDLFVAAYEAMESSEGNILESRRPTRPLGRLGVERRFMLPVDSSLAGQTMGIGTTVHHICLMRTAELVVCYHAGPKPPAEQVSYAGVFRVDPALDSFFADAEPPTHDAWRWQSLEGPAKTLVRQTFTRLKEKMETLVGVNDGVRGTSAEVPLGAASRAFASLVAGAWGIGGGTNFGRVSRPDGTRTSHTSEGAGTSSTETWEPAGDSPASTTPQSPPDTSHDLPKHAHDPERYSYPPLPPARSAPKRRRLRLEYLDEPYFDVRQGHVVLIQAFRAPEPGPQRIRAELAVSLPGSVGRETDPPRNAAQPELFGWEDESGVLNRSTTTMIEGGDHVWRLIVNPAPDTMTEISLRVDTGDDVS